MIRNLIRCCAVALVSSPLLAAAQSAPTATQSASSATQAVPAANEPKTTLRANADLVLVDVVASDEKQNPMHHLTSGDFTILEDGKPQTVKIFEEHAAGPPPRMPPAPKFGPGVFTNFSQAPETGSLNILLFDKLNTPLNAQSEVRDQVLKYLKEAPPGTRMAIFSLSTDLRLLQGFTSDPELLRALVIGKKGSQGASPLMNNAMNGDQPGDDDAMMEATTDALGNDPDAATIIADLQQFEAQQQAFQIQLRQQYTLDALNQLARYMSNLPGRKNLIWFSGSFPISILPDPDLQNPFAIVSSAEDEFRETVDLLSRSQVAVYPIDARGLMTEPMADVSQSGSAYVNNPGAFGKNSTKFFQKTAEEHGTMEQMARATGGKAFVNTNGLKDAIENAVESGSNYYTIGYTPENRNWNREFRKITVNVDKQGVTLAYRRGYFADDPDKPAQKNAPENALSNTTQYNPVRAAMMRGAPDPTELIFVAMVRPSSSATEDAAADGNQLGKKVNGPFRRYTISFLANPRQVHCAAGADGVHHCDLEFMTFVYDAGGTLVNMQTNGISAGFTEEHFASAMGQNFSYRQQISVPAKGEYYLRIGMRDGTSGTLGALELPVASVAKLPPADQVAPAAGAAQPAPTEKPAAK
jgi:VWFA-related protein